MRSTYWRPLWPCLAIGTALLSACGGEVRTFGNGGGTTASSSTSTSASSTGSTDSTGSTSNSSGGGSETTLCVLGSGKVGNCVLGP
jgi:hypothetical protein